jgi:hypothetical protein
MEADAASQKANIRIALDRTKFVPVCADLAHGLCRVSSAVVGKVYSVLGVERTISHPLAQQSSAIGAFVVQFRGWDEESGLKWEIRR